MEGVRVTGAGGQRERSGDEGAGGQAGARAPEMSVVRKDQRESQVWQERNQKKAEDMSRRSSSMRATWRGRSKKRPRSNSGTPRACAVVRGQGQADGGERETRARQAAEVAGGGGLADWRRRRGCCSGGTGCSLPHVHTEWHAGAPGGLPGPYSHWATVPLPGLDGGAILVIQKAVYHAMQLFQCRWMAMALPNWAVRHSTEKRLGCKCYVSSLHRLSSLFEVITQRGNTPPAPKGNNGQPGAKHAGSGSAAVFPVLGVNCV